MASAGGDGWDQGTNTGRGRCFIPHQLLISLGIGAGLIQRANSVMSIIQYLPALAAARPRLRLRAPLAARVVRTIAPAPTKERAAAARAANGQEDDRFGLRSHIFDSAPATLAGCACAAASLHGHNRLDALERGTAAR